MTAPNDPWRWHWLVNVATGRCVKCLAWRERINGSIVHEHIDANSIAPGIGDLLRGDWELANECEGVTCQPTTTSSTRSPLRGCEN